MRAAHSHARPARPRFASLGLFALLIGPAVTGCDEAKSLITGPDAGPTGVQIEGDPETPLTELDDTQVDGLCTAFYQAAVRQMPPETRCSVVGIPAGVANGDGTAGGELLACEEAVATCVRVASVGGQALPDLVTGACFMRQPGEGCTATLGTLQPCLDAMADAAVGQVRATLKCNLADLSTVQIPAVEPPDPDGIEVCARFTATCPGLFGSPTTDMGAGASDMGLDASN
jgi:hypothetical protein